MSDRSRALTSATTYQAIVIALVAAGIISIGVMSVCYRRRRREQWEQTVRAGLDRARHRHGYGDPLGVDGHGGEGVDLAEKPVMWDVDIGGKGEDWVPIRVGMDKDDGPTPWRPSMTPNSMIKAPEQPLSNTINTNVELTILVAMPQPPFAPDQTRPLTDSSSSRPKSSTSLNSIDLKDPDADPFTLSELPHYSPTRAELDTEELPHVEIGTAVVPLSIRNAEDQEEVQEMRLGKMQSRAGIAGDWGRTQTQESNAR